MTWVSILSIYGLYIYNQHILNYQGHRTQLLMPPAVVLPRKKVHTGYIYCTHAHLPACTTPHLTHTYLPAHTSSASHYLHTASPPLPAAMPFHAEGLHFTAHTLPHSAAALHYLRTPRRELCAYPAYCDWWRILPRACLHRWVYASRHCCPAITSPTRLLFPSQLCHPTTLPTPLHTRRVCLHLYHTHHYPQAFPLLRTRHIPPLCRCASPHTPHPTLSPHPTLCGAIRLKNLAHKRMTTSLLPGTPHTAHTAPSEEHENTREQASLTAAHHTTLPFTLFTHFAAPIETLRVVLAGWVLGSK